MMLYSPNRILDCWILRDSIAHKLRDAWLLIALYFLWPVVHEVNVDGKSVIDSEVPNLNGWC